MTKKNNTQLDPDTIYETLKSKYDLFSDPSGMPFATIKDKNNETVPTLDIKFIRSVTRNIHNQTNRPPLSNLVKSYITLLEDDALNGPIKKVWLRYAYEENIIYVDTADENGNIIKITAGGPTVIPKQECPEVFYKTKRTRSLPMPDFEGSIDEILSIFSFRESTQYSFTSELHAQGNDTHRSYPSGQHQWASKYRENNKVSPYQRPNRSDFTLDNRNTKFRTSIIYIRN